MGLLFNGCRTAEGMWGQDRRLNWGESKSGSRSLGVNMVCLKAAHSPDDCRQINSDGEQVNSVAHLNMSHEAPLQDVSTIEIIAVGLVPNTIHHTPLPSFSISRSPKVNIRAASPYSPRHSTGTKASSPSIKIRSVQPVSERLVRFVSPHPLLALQGQGRSGAEKSLEAQVTRYTTTRRGTPALKAPVSDSDGEDSEDEGDKIPKPEGEVGRPKRGGYNLRQKLDWSSNDYEAVNVSPTKIVMHEI